MPTAYRIWRAIRVSASAADVTEKLTLYENIARALTVVSVFPCHFVPQSIFVSASERISLGSCHPRSSP